jgi:hypothetical protein
MKNPPSELPEFSVDKQEARWIKSWERRRVKEQTLFILWFGLCWGTLVFLSSQAVIWIGWHEIYFDWVIASLFALCVLGGFSLGLAAWSTNEEKYRGYTEQDLQ